MSAITAVSLSKTVASAVAVAAGSNGKVVYSPVGFIQPGVAKWVDKSGGVPLLYPSFTASVRLPTSGSRNCRVVAKVVLPTGDVTAPSTSSGIQPAPSKAYECIGQLELMLPERSTSEERNTLRSLLLSVLSDLIYAGDFDPADNTASPLPSAIDNFEMPY